jgi:hypothetical protein
MSAPFIRLAAQVFASVGVSKVVNDVIKNNTSIITTTDAVRVWAGSLVIGSMIADNAAKHVNDRVTEVLEWNQNRKAANVE